MKIEYNDNSEIADISKLEIGECFMFDAELYVKISVDGLASTLGRNILLFPNAVVNLSKSELNSFNDGVDVVKVQAKILVNTIM